MRGNRLRHDVLEHEAVTLRCPAGVDEGQGIDQKAIEIGTDEHSSRGGWLQSKNA